MTIQITCIPTRNSNSTTSTNTIMRRYSRQQQSCSRIKGGGGGNNNLFITLLLVCIWTIQEAQANWGSDGGEMDETYFGNTFTRSWLYDSEKLSFQVEGCAWGYVEDSEEVGCLEDESEDGTTNWYMMANCRRPQVAFSVYSGSSCSSSNFVGSFVTTGGVSEFVYLLQNYGGAGDMDDDAYGGGDDLPICEQSDDGGYIGLDCSDDNGFAINYFNDEYCVSRTGTQYNQMSGLNNIIGSYMSCTTVSSYNNNDGDNDGGNLVQQLVYYADPCTSLDYDLCSDNEYFEERSSSSGRAKNHHKGWSSRAYIGGHKSWVTKLKYVVGGLFLLASFIMFTGILFTNRRRRRAMMMRKYRQAKKQKRERNRETSSRRSSKSKRRSKSRNKEKSKDKERERDNDGVFT